MNKEIDLIKEIFDLKKIKSDHIKNQRYEQAANSRDLERQSEIKLMDFLVEIGEFMIYDLSNPNQELKYYFELKYKIVYPNNMLTDKEQNYYDNFIKSLLRGEKLKELGI